MSKKEKATAITKRNIQDAFWSFYKEMPMDKIRINAVMERAGYNRGTFYEYFKSLEDVLHSIEQELYLDFLQRVTSFDPNGESGASMLMNAVEIIMAHRERLAVLLGENGDSKFRETLIKGTSIAIDNHLRATVGNRVDCDANPTYKYFVDFVATGLWGTMVKWAADVDAFSEESVKELSKYFDGVDKISEEFCIKMLSLKQ